MKKPSPIAIIALCVVAVSILAFTINDELNKRKKNSSAGALVASKNVTIPSPFVAYNPPHGKPGHRHDLPDGAPLPNAAPPSGATSNQNTTANNLSFKDTRTPEPIANSTTALNPAHGQPGHKCEIAVGAPLSSAPANTQTTAPAAAPVSQVPPSGKNPAHGQPGHRCDIAVGAPLNSAPTKATTATSSTTTTPVVTKAASVAPGLNPAHGQPGHRCDIAVGAPLDSPAKTTSTTSPAAATNNSAPSPLFPNYSFPVSDSAKR